MNPRTTGMLAAVAALLGGFIYFYEIGGEATRNAADQAELRIFAGLDAIDIEAITLRTQDGIEAHFGRSDGTGSWELLDPWRAPADGIALDGIAGALANLSRAGRIETPMGLAEYGLADDAQIVRFEVKGEPKGLRIGRSTPLGGNLYVAPLGSESVSYVATFRLNALKRNLADLRDRSILSFEPADVTALSLAWPGSEIAFEKQEGAWTIRSPVEDRADATTLSNLLTDLSYLRAVDFVDEQSAATSAAMEELALEFRLTTSGEMQRVTIGGRLEGQRVVRGPTGQIFTIAPERLDDFERTVSAYRFRTLSDFEVSAARRLILRFETEAGEQRVVEARLEGAGWIGQDPSIDPERAADLVREMAQLRATAIVADAMGPAERASIGLAPPRVSIRVEAEQRVEEKAEAEADAGPLAEVAIGRLHEQRGLYAQRVGDPKIYLLDSGVARDLPISWLAFGARFEAEAVAAAEQASTSPEADPDADPIDDELPIGLELP